MSAKQKAALEAAFASPGLSCMMVCSEIPFVTGPPNEVQDKSKKIVFLEGHWAYHEAETTWL
jgi:hypothetical protein